MRPLVSLVALPFLCVSGSLLVVAACEDPDGSGGQADASAEGSVSPSPTGTTPVSPDGAPPTRPDAGPSVVTVRVRDVANKAVAGASVLFSDAAGAQLALVASDANGVATFAAPSGAQVTVGFGDDLLPRLLTITGVEPGDDLVAADVDAYGDGPSRSLRIETLPANPPGGVQTYARLGPCFGSLNTTPASLSFAARCAQRSASFPVLVDRRDGNGLTTGWTAAKNVSFVADGGETPVSFPAWTTGYVAQTVTVKNAADAGGNLYVAYGEIANGVVVPDSSYVGPTGNERSATFRGHAGFGEALQAEAYAYDYSVTGGGMGLIGTAVRAAAPTTDGGVDLEWGNRLPTVTGAGVDAGVSARPSVTWTTAGSLASADGTYVVLSWSEPRDAGQALGTWTVIAPPTATSVQVPAIPAGFKGAPSTVPSYANPPRILTVEASFVPGYAQLRAAGAALTPSTEVLQGGGSANVPALPSNGAVVRFTAYTRNND